MYAPGPGWAPGGAATGQEWGYIRELRFSSRFLNDVTLVLVSWSWCEVALNHTGGKSRGESKQVKSE